MNDTYHHGNLKNELIENAIRIISEKGFDGLSLRRISAQCGVSHNAVYRHFESKERLIECCREHVTETLTENLKRSIEGLDNTDPETVNKLGYAYIQFYREHPTYFSFLYRNTSVKINFTMEYTKGNYPPFEVFRSVCRAITERRKMTYKEGLRRLVRYWSLMHGAISLMISPNVALDGEWDEILKDIF
jgi:AcrR family transcriptional regulator